MSKKKETSWGFDDERKIQYRRVDGYISDLRSEVVTHPGKNNSPSTVSFHRPIQSYFKAPRKAGFLVSRLEEWSSARRSQNGPRAVAEDRARREFPLFLFLEAVKT